MELVVGVLLHPSAKRPKFATLQIPNESYKLRLSSLRE
jgi:hypothetical protein